MRESSTPDDLLHSIVNSLPARIFWKDTESRYLGCNTAFALDAGLSDPREIVGRTDFELPWRSEAAMYRQHDREVMTTGVPELGIEEPQTTPEGGTRWLSTSKVPLRDKARNVVGVIGIYEDVTDRWKAEEALRESEARNRSIIEASMDGFWLTDHTGDLVEVNDAYCRMSGYSAEELIGRNARELTILGTDEDPPSYIRRAMEQGSTRFEARYRRKDGTTFDAEVSIQYRAEGGGRFAAFHRDITERKRADAALQQSHDMMTKLTAQVPGVVYQYRLYPDGRSCFPFSSSGMRDIYEVESEEVREDATPVFGRLHPEDLERVSTLIFDSARTLDPFHCEFRVNLPRQGIRWRLCDAMPSRTEDGGTLWYGIISDITERKHAEEQLRHSLKEKEGLLREVHHRVKNNLQVISSLLRLETSRSDVADTQRVLHDMQGRILSMAVLHETLYRSGRFGQVELGAYLRQLALQLFRATAGAARLNTEMTPVSVELDQAIPCGLILNELLTNSLKHAFKEGLGGEVRVSLAQNDSGEVTLTVADTGVGLPSDFETRKSRSLGLQLVTDLVRQIGGRLAILQGPGAGFVVTFTPIAAHAASPGPPSGDAVPSP